MEIWKMHPVFTDYEVSDLGRVRRRTAKIGTRAGKMRKQYINDNGYAVVTIETKVKKVHALVLETFASARPDKHDACHNDGNRTNNVLSNLRWATRKENMADCVAHGTSEIAKNAAIEYWKDPVNRAKKSDVTRNFNQDNPERYAEILAARIARVKSPGTREKMRLAKLGKKQSPEVIAKRLETKRINRQVRLLADALL